MDIRVYKCDTSIHLSWTEAVGGGRLIAVTQEGSREGQHFSPFKEHESLEGTGVGASLLPEGAKRYIPTYGTVQTTDGDSLWSFNINP